MKTKEIFSENVEWLKTNYQIFLEIIKNTENSLLKIFQIWCRNHWKLTTLVDKTEWNDENEKNKTNEFINSTPKLFEQILLPIKPIANNNHWKALWIR